MRQKGFKEIIILASVLVVGISLFLIFKPRQKINNFVNRSSEYSSTSKFSNPTPSVNLNLITPTPNKTNCREGSHYNGQVIIRDKQIKGFCEIENILDWPITEEHIDRGYLMEVPSSWRDFTLRGATGNGLFFSFNPKDEWASFFFVTMTHEDLDLESYVQKEYIKSGYIKAIAQENLTLGKWNLKKVITPDSTYYFTDITKYGTHIIYIFEVKTFSDNEIIQRVIKSFSVNIE